MTNKRYFAVPLLAMLAFGATACSSSSTDPGGTIAPSTTGRPARVVGKIGPCPKNFPRIKLSTLNQGVPGLGAALVPFAAQNGRVCIYNLERLTGSGTLGPEAAEKFGHDTNALPKAPAPSDCADGNVSARRFFVTLDDGTKRVHLGESDACGGGVSNSVFIARETPAWTAELVELATEQEATAATTTTTP